MSVPGESEPTDIRLTEWTTCGGCAAKWGASALVDVLPTTVQSEDPDLLAAFTPFEDAAVYRLAPGLALVVTTDFFPPLVDSPDDYGAIAAANACSDIFAMGARVVTAVNVAAFPKDFPPSAVRSIFSAASETVREAGGHLVGGHTIRSPEPIFGLAVQGVVDPSRVFRKAGALDGDVLLLSKPVGAALALASPRCEDKAAATSGMRRLNRRAAEQLGAVDRHVHAVTDVTGFGLAGHAWEIAEQSGVTLRIDTRALPLYTGALESARNGHLTGGDARNREYVGEHVKSTAPYDYDAVCYDPQTSGGLLASVSPEIALRLVDDATREVPSSWTRIGSVAAGPSGVWIR